MGHKRQFRNNDRWSVQKTEQMGLEVDTRCLWKRRTDPERNRQTQHYWTKAKSPHTAQGVGPSHAVSGKPGFRALCRTCRNSKGTGTTAVRQPGKRQPGSPHWPPCRNSANSFPRPRHMAAQLRGKSTNSWTHFIHTKVSEIHHTASKYTKIPQ